MFPGSLIAFSCIVSNSWKSANGEAYRLDRENNIKVLQKSTPLAEIEQERKQERKLAHYQPETMREYLTWSENFRFLRRVAAKGFTLEMQE